jgi:WD40 repeat protein
MNARRIAVALTLAASLTLPTAAATDDAIRFSSTLAIGSIGGLPFALAAGRGLLATSDDGRIRIFQVRSLGDVALRELAGVARPDWYYQLAFSPDGTTLAGAGEGATLWSTQDWRVRWSLPKTESVNALAYARDGATLYLASASAFIEALGVADGVVRWKVPALETRTSRIAISPDGTIAAVGSYGGGLRLVSTVDGSTLDKLADVDGHGGKTTAAQRAGWLAHPGAIEALAFSSDGARLASAGGDGTIKLWDVSNRSVIWTNVCGDATATVAFEKGERVLDAGCGQTIRRLAANHWTNPRNVARSRQRRRRFGGRIRRPRSVERFGNVQALGPRER